MIYIRSLLNNTIHVCKSDSQSAGICPRKSDICGLTDVHKSICNEELIATWRSTTKK